MTTRRALRRRYAILGALHEHGPQYAIDLCAALRLASGTIYPDLAALEADSRICGEWIEQPDGRPRRRRYRITTDHERDLGRRVRQQVDAAITELVTEWRRPRRPAARPETRTA